VCCTIIKKNGSYAMVLYTSDLVVTTALAAVFTMSKKSRRHFPVYPNFGDIILCLQYSQKSVITDTTE